MESHKGGSRTRGAQKQSSSSAPLVSIITVVYNGEKHLEQTIQSVLSQSYKNIEYIIIDGGSTDGTLEIIKKYEEEIDYWKSEPDKGIYDAMNKGIELAQGELIGLINSDDFYELDAVELVVKKYKENMIPQVLYGDTYILRDDLKIRYKSYSHMRYWHGMSIVHPAMFVHKEIYRTNGKYALSYRIASDYDFMLRAILNRVPFVRVDTFIANYRDSGLTARNFGEALHENREILRRHFGFFSIEHLVYYGLFIKSTALILMQRIIGLLLGERLLDKARFWYLKKFFAREYENIE